MLPQKKLLVKPTDFDISPSQNAIMLSPVIQQKVPAQVVPVVPIVYKKLQYVPK